MFELFVNRDLIGKRVHDQFATPAGPKGGVPRREPTRRAPLRAAAARAGRTLGTATSTAWATLTQRSRRRAGELT